MLIRCVHRIVYSRKFGMARAVLQVVTLALLFSLVFLMYEQVNTISDGIGAAAPSLYGAGESLSRHRRNSGEYLLFSHKQNKDVTY